MDVINVIPLGTEVEIKESGKLGTIVRVTIGNVGVGEKEFIEYNVSVFSEGQGRHSIWVSESDLAGKYEKQTILQTMKITKEVNKVKTEELSPDLINSINILNSKIGATFNVMAKGFYIPINAGDDDTADRGDITSTPNVLPYVEICDSGMYSDDGVKIILSNDKVFKCYDVDVVDDYISDTPTAIFNRGVRLKPFYKRWFTTLRYGRDHSDNFEVIESDEAYLTRVVNELIQMYPKGFMCNKLRVSL